jgi:signal transduction histidine kinase
MTSMAADPALMDGYLREDDALRLSMSKIAHVIALAAVLGGTMLDLFVYPELQWSFLQLRLLADAVMLLMLAFHFTEAGRRHVRVLSMLWVLFMSGFLSLLIYRANGAASPYYAGINLVLLGVAVLLPFTLRETIIACIGTVIFYVAACWFQASGAGEAFDGGLFFNNFFFMFVTILICLISSHVSSGARFRDYDLRHQLDGRNQKLRELDRLKSQFFANISHELRTPLTLILSPVQDLLQQSHSINDRTRDGLELVRDNALRLLRLINDLLEIVQLEGGRLELHLEPVDVSTYVPGMVDSVRHLGESKGIRMVVKGSVEPLIVHADPSRLEKVLLNLLTNAIKFTPEDGTITARWNRVGDQICVEVRDTGIGIPAGELSHVFDRFHQVDGSSTRKFQGAGLGLALARELIEEHGGTLTVQSEEGQGACFAILLPVGSVGSADQVHQPHWQDVEEADPIARVMRQASDAKVAVGSQSDPIATDVAQGSGPLVLVVDDEPDMRRFMTSVLCSEFRVLEAEDGPMGIERAIEHQPDLILLDMMLPGLTGLEVCQALKKHERTADTKIILLTARADETTKIEALELGADDFLTKPFSSIEVKTRMRNLLESARLQRDLRDRNVELERTLAQLRSTESQLVQSEKMNALGNLAAGLLHEINNPLNYTMTALQLLQESDPMDEEVADGLKDIDEGMSRIRDIVVDLRAFATPNHAGQSQLFPLSEAVETALRFTAGQCEGLGVDRDVAADAVVECSKSHIVQVLVNLISNSVDAVKGRANGSSPSIRIEATRNGERAHIGVIDNGAGIEPEHLGQVFDPFFTTKDVGQGMGLGLSVCHTIVKNHGGSIRVESVPNRGTEVWFDLPLAEAGSPSLQGEDT